MSKHENQALLIDLLNKEKYLTPKGGGKFDSNPLIDSDINRRGVELSINVKPDLLHLDFAVQFLNADKQSSAAYDFCSQLAHEIMDKHTEFKLSDYARLDDEIIFQYLADMNRVGPSKIISILRSIVGI